MYTRYFIPFRALGPLPGRAGLFSMGGVLAPDLPGVPRGIRFVRVFATPALLETIETARAACLAAPQERTEGDCGPA